MKNERLLKVFGQIDEKYILEASPQMIHGRKTNNSMTFLRRPAAMAASLALFICVAGTTVLAATGVLQGFFVDIFDWKGAVVGTSYAQATDEITLTVTDVTDGIGVEMVMVYPGQFPYREIEMFGIANYKIVDRSGNVVTEGNVSEMAPVIDGKASVRISEDPIPEGSYKLIISELVGSKKGEQPLILTGNWVCAFTG